jgi:hypothetical protein
MRESSRSITSVRVVAMLLITLVLAAVPAGAAPGSQDLMRNPSPVVPNEYIVQLKVPPGEVVKVAAELAERYDATIVQTWQYALIGFWARMSDADAHAMRSDRRVVSIEANTTMSNSSYEKTGVLSGTLLPQVTVGGTSDIGAYPDAFQKHPLWHLTRINTRQWPATLDADNFYKYSYCSTGKNVVVYVIDTGTFKLHQEFLLPGSTPSPSRANPADYPNVLEVPGSNMLFVDHNDLLPSTIPNPYCDVPINSTTYGGYHWFDSQPWFVDPPNTEISHGMACASLIGGQSVGVAKEATIIPVKVIGCNYYTSTAYVISALNWVTSNEASYKLQTGQRRAAVVSMSTFKVLNSRTNPVIAGDVEGREALETAVNGLTDFGIPLVASANNLSTEACYTAPAELSRRGGHGRVITVGGLAKREAGDARWIDQSPGSVYSSNFGTCVDIMAPAENITVADPKSWNAYRQTNASGTSFSAPIVAGIVARLMSEDPALTSDLNGANPSLTVDKVWERLRETATIADPSADLGQDSPRLIAYIGGVPISTQPTDQNVPVVGTTGNLTVATAVPGATYQWFDVTSGTAIPAGSGATLSVSKQIPGEWKYFARVSAGCMIDGTMVASDSAVATIHNACGGFITQQPKSWWQKAGETTIPDLQVGYLTAVSTPTPAVQWYHSHLGQSDDQYMIANGNGPTLTGQVIKDALVSGELEPTFWARITAGACHFDSDVAQLHLCEAPVLSQATATDVSAGSASTLTVTASAGTDIFYQWYRQDGNAWVPLFGGSLTLNVPVTNNYFPVDTITIFKVEISNSCGQITSALVTSTVTSCGSAFAAAIQGILPTPRAGTCSSSYNNAVAPQSYVLCTSQNQPATLRQGTYLDMTYQWESKPMIRDAPYATIVGATNNVLIDNPARATMYRITASSPSCGSATSFDFGVMVRPNIVGVAENAAGNGLRVTAVDPNGSQTPMAYQWYRIAGGEPELMTGLTADTLPFTEMNPGEAYFVRVTNTVDVDAPGFNGTYLHTTASADSSPVVSSCTFLPPLDLWNPSVGGGYQPSITGVNVPSGRNLVLSARAMSTDGSRLTSPSYFTWTFDDGHTDSEYRTVYQAATSGPHVVKVRFDSGMAACNSGSADDHTYVINTVPASCALVQSYPSGPVSPISQTATVALSVTPAAGANVTYEWRSGNLLDAQLSRPLEALAPISTSASVTVPPGIYWVRVRGLCPSDGVTPIVEDSPPIIVHCSDCHPRIAPHVAGYPFVNSLSSDAGPIPVTQGVNFQLDVPAVIAGATYQWFKGLSSGEPALWLTHTSATEIDQTDVSTTYWVLTTEASGAQTQSYPAIVNVQPPSAVTVSVSPSQIVQYESIVRLTAQTTGINQAAYKWHRGPLGTDDVVGIEATYTFIALADEVYWVEVTGTNTTGSIDSAVIPITTTCTGFQPLVSIITRPLGGHLSKTDYAWMTAFGTGKNLYYEWYVDAVGDYPFANSQAVLATPTHDTLYVVRATDACGNQTTAQSFVRLCIPTIDLQPASTVLAPNGSVTLTVHATPAQAGQPLTYQWYRGVSGLTVFPISGANSTQLALTSADVGDYWVGVGGACDDGPFGTSSDTATITVCSPPAIPNASTQINTTFGQIVALTVTATGQSLSYQWYQGTAGDTSHPIGGNNAPSLQYNATTDATFWVRVTSQGVCTTDSPTLVVALCPTMVAPISADATEVMPGTVANLTASGAGLPPLTYHWYQSATLGDTTNPVGSNSATFATPPLTATTSYWASVTHNGCVAYPDASVTINVCGAMTVGWIGSSHNIHSSEAGTLSLNPSIAPGDITAVYWYSGTSSNVAQSQLLSGPTNNLTYNLAPTQTTSYWARITKGNCYADTPTLTLTVCIPTVTLHPGNATINGGQSAPLTVAGDLAGLTVQWYTGASGSTANPIAGATSTTYNASPGSTTSYWARLTSSCGATADSNAATVTVVICQPPSAITVSGGGSIMRGQAMILSAGSTGTSITYQWYQGSSGDTSTPIYAGAQTISVTPQDKTNYWVRVTGTCGSLNSTTVTVNVCVVPVITSQPQSQSIFTGNTATLSVAATVATTTPLTYQWYRGASGDTSNPATSPSTSPSFTTSALTTDTSYWVAVSADICGPTQSDAALVSMCLIPQNMTAAPDQSISIGQTAHLNLGIIYPPTGNTFFWYQGVAGDTSHPLGDYAGDWGPYNYIDVSPTVTTHYWAQVKNGTCIGSTGTTTVNVCIPVITQQPGNVTIGSGSTTLSVVSNLPGSTYQWYVGTSGTTTTPISGATSASVTVSPTTTTSYWCRVSGSCGTANSNTATVTVCAPATVSTQPTATPALINSGASSTLTLGVTGATPLTVQWFTSGGTLVGSGTTLVVYPTVATTYHAAVSNSCPSSTTSANVTVTVCVPPGIITQPTSNPSSITYPASSTLSIVGAGTAPTIQWYASGGVAVGTGASLTLTPTSTTSYYATLTNQCGSMQSSTTTITVCVPAGLGTAPTATPATISSGGTSKIEATTGTGSGTLTYLFYKSDGTLLQSSANKKLTVSPTVTTTYYYKVSNDCGTSAASPTVTVTVQ